MTVESTESPTWQPAWRLREMIGEKKISPTQVIEHFLARIAELEPTLHAFDTLDAEGAMEQAAAATRAVEEGAELGPLHGIPVAIMDVHSVKGFRNGLLGRDAVNYDEIAVERIRKAGGIIIGTTATYNWSVDEKPRNPWNLELDPGNSSRGSAIAVVAGMVPLAIGMDGAGSTRLPAAWSGCIGLNTSKGLVPYVDYDSPSFRSTSTAGPMARDARDCALLLQVIAGPDGRDFQALQLPVPDYTAHIDDGVKDMDIAWTDDFGWSKAYWLPDSAGVVEFVKNAAFGMARSGAHVEQIADVWDEPMPIFNLLSKHLPGINPVAPGFDPEAGQKRLDEAWGVPETETPSPLPQLWPDNLSPSEEYRLASEKRAQMIDTLEKVLAKHQVLISATSPMEARTHKEWGYFGRGFVFTTYSAHTAMLNVIGYPAISVPCGLLNGLPVGMQIIARPGQEDLLLRVAEAVQKLYPIPHPPSVA